MLQLMKLAKVALSIVPCLVLAVGCASQPSPVASRGERPIVSTDQPTRQSHLTTPVTTTTQSSARPNTGAIGRLAKLKLIRDAELDSAQCKHLLNVTGERCEISRQLDGQVAVVRVVTECQGDSCSLRNFVLTTRPQPIELPGDDGRGGNIEGGDIVITPDQDYAICDNARPAEKSSGEWQVSLARVSLVSQKVTHFADCMSPALSPARHWIICRNRTADVLRVSLKGGRPQIVIPSGAKRHEVDWVPWAWRIPGPVRFESPSQLVYEITAPGGAPVTIKKSAWKEQ